MQFLRRAVDNSLTDLSDGAGVRTIAAVDFVNASTADDIVVAFIAAEHVVSTVAPDYVISKIAPNGARRRRLPKMVSLSSPPPRTSFHGPPPIVSSPRSPSMMSLPSPLCLTLQVHSREPHGETLAHGSVRLPTLSCCGKKVLHPLPRTDSARKNHRRRVPDTKDIHKPSSGEILRAIFISILLFSPDGLPVTSQKAGLPRHKRLYRHCSAESCITGLSHPFVVMTSDAISSALPTRWLLCCAPHPGRASLRGTVPHV